MDATLALVAKGGYSAATIEAISEHTGVARTTIYRWWPNRAALVVDLLVEVAAATAPSAAGADSLLAIRTEMRMIARASEGLAGRLLIALLGEAERDPEVHAALVRGLFTPRRAATAKVIRSAQRMGLVRKDVEPRLVGDLFYGPMFYRKYIRGEKVTQSFVDRIFDCALEGLRAGAASARPRRRRTPPTALPSP